MDIKQNNELAIDWTDYFDQKIIAGRANEIIDSIIHKIHSKNIQIYSSHALSLQEISLLYRWPIHVGVNIFIERLLRVTYSRIMNLSSNYPMPTDQNGYFPNTAKSVKTYYYDFSTNYRLLNDLSEIISRSSKNEQSSINGLHKPQEALEHVEDGGLSLKKVLKTNFLAAEKKYIKIFKPKVVGEYSNWFREIFFFGHSIDFYSHKFADQNEKVNTAARDVIKRICSNIFIDHIPIILDELDSQQIKQCGKRFEEWIDHILPLSIVEGFEERFHYYQKKLKDWPVEQIHAFTGYFYNDNFKVFALLAKRRGAKYIGHGHGADNYIDSFYKMSNELRFLDFYTIYGTKVPDYLLNNPGLDKVEFLPTGSTYLNKIKKWHISSISLENFTLLYPSNPLMDFMSDLQEISTKNNLKHRFQVLNFLNRLLQKYPGLNIMYKPFPGTFINDPIKSICAEWFNKGRIELCEKKLVQMYYKVDIVIWDSISTGFAESIVSGVPVIVYNSKYELEKLSQRGKIVNDSLMHTGVECLDSDTAMKSFERILNNFDEYTKETSPAIQMFKDDMATSVTRREWHRRFRSGISQVRGVA